MPGTVKSGLLSDADKSYKCDSQEKVCWMLNLLLDKSHFITVRMKIVKIGFKAVEVKFFILLCGHFVKALLPLMSRTHGIKSPVNEQAEAALFKPFSVIR